MKKEPFADQREKVQAIIDSQKDRIAKVQKEMKKPFREKPDEDELRIPIAPKESPKDEKGNKHKEKS